MSWTAAARPTTPRDSAASELLGMLVQIRFQWDNPDGSVSLVADLEDGSVVRGTVESRGELVPGSRYRFLGKWREHERYGYQFAFDAALLETPDDPDGLAAYLSRHADRIGLVTAAKLVAAYGADAARVLVEDPDRVAADGIMNTEDAALASDSLKRVYADPALREAHQQLFALLRGHGFYAKAIKAALRKWRASAPSQVRRDPFLLMTSGLPGCGFLKCDRLWLAMKKSPRRLKRQSLAAWHALAMLDGDTWADVGEALKAVRTQIGGTQPRERRAVALLCRARLAECVTDDAGRVWVAERHKAVSERACAHYLKVLGLAPVNWPAVSELRLNPETDSHQIEQVSKALSASVCLLTGNPGVGKTHVAAEVIRATMRRVGEAKIAVVCPTGKAAVRITEKMAEAKLMLKATTIHGCLKVAPVDSSVGDGWGFTHGPDNPLPYSHVFLDECFPAGTMIDTPTGQKDISTIAVGDRITNAIGSDVVVAVGKKEVHHAIRIEVGGEEVIASENHPFFTARGVVFARDLGPGDSLLSTVAAMRLLRHDARESLPRDQAILRTCLQRELVDGYPESQGEAPIQGDETEDRRRTAAMAAVGASESDEGTGANRRPQPIAPPGSSREVITDHEGERAQTQSQGRQRPRLDGDGGGAGERAARLAPTHPPDANASQRRLPDALQARPGRSGTDDLHRTGRLVAQRQGEAGAGPEEDGVPQCGRVDCVEVLEPGDPRLDRYRDAGGKLYFYDLQAARHRSFSVRGCLVHNCSMVDVSLMASFLSALTPGTNVMMIGDPAQLPPVGHGAFLRDVIAAEINRGHLSEIRRNAGRIVTACHEIKDGKTPRLPDALTAWPRENLIQLPWPKGQTPREGNQAIKDRLDSLYDWLGTLPQVCEWQWSLLDDVQVIVARNATRQALNAHLQQRLNAAGARAPHGNWRAGDKVICLKNGFVIDAEDRNGKQVYVCNGVAGRVLEFKGKHAVVKLASPARKVLVPLTKAAEEEQAAVAGREDTKGMGGRWDLAFAVTAHKSQGSEWRVIIYLVEAAGKLGSRELIYTAISRARDLCVVLGDRNDVRKYVANVVLPDRKTFLAERLKGEMP